MSESITIQDRRGRAEFRYTAGNTSEYIFTVDIYAYRHHTHPSRHLGWWRFELPVGKGVAELQLNFDPIQKESIVLSINGEHLFPTDEWHNPLYEFDPLGDLQLVFRDSQKRVQHIESTLLKFVDRDILRDFYQRHFESEGYTPPKETPFLWKLHDYKMERLEKLFQRYIPRDGRMVDVGCGRSLVSDMKVGFPFTVFAGDIEHEAIRTRASEVPFQRWGVFDADALPFEDNQFDVLFAGEIIEHMSDVEQTLYEWNRVLKPGGVAIITTPNRKRLVAVFDGHERPYSVDHLSELSYQELAGPLLERSGFEFVEQSCIHLELFLTNLFSSAPVDDFLQVAGNREKYVWLMKRMFPLGRLVPRHSMAMVVVGRKVGACKVS